MNKFSICSAGLLAVCLFSACEKPAENEEKVIAIPSKEDMNKIQNDVNNIAEKTEAAATEAAEEARKAGEAAKEAGESMMEGAGDAMKQMDSMNQAGE